MGTTSGHEAAEEAQAFSEGHTSGSEVMLEAFQPQENGEALAPVEAQYEADFIPSNTTLGVNAEMQTGRGPMRLAGGFLKLAGSMLTAAAAMAGTHFGLPIIITALGFELGALVVIGVIITSIIVGVVVFELLDQLLDL